MDEFLARFTLFGVPSLAVVIALVEIVKRVFGLPTKWYPLASLIAGLIVAGVMLLLDIVPAAEPYVMYTLAGLLLGLAAMGAYAGVKTIVGFKSVPPGSDVVEPTGNRYTVPDNK